MFSPEMQKKKKMIKKNAGEFLRKRTDVLVEPPKETNVGIAGAFLTS